MPVSTPPCPELRPIALAQALLLACLTAEPSLANVVEPRVFWLGVELSF